MKTYTKFFTIINPFLKVIDNGVFFRKPIGWLYSIIAIFNILLPFYLIYKAIDNNVFYFYGEEEYGLSEFKYKIFFVFLIIWIVIAFASWISFQIWWNRKSKINFTSDESSEFIAIPAVAHLIQTLGEWIGTWVAIVGFLLSLIFTLVFSIEIEGVSSLVYLIGLPFLETSIKSILLMPIYGYGIIVISRLISEQIQVLAKIANNTRKNY